MIRIAEKHETEKKAMRDTYCETLIKLASENDKIVHLDADLLNCIAMAPFQKRFPERTFDLGIQEANMIGTAAGMSAAGLIPFAHSFAPFASRRCYDQIFMSCAYARLNVRIIGSDPGITAAFNGGTHMPFEDMGILRNIPEITIIEPADTVMLRDMLIQTAGMYGVFYIRMLRKNPVKIYDEGSTFEIGKGVTLREGKDVTIIATGIMVKEALDAADRLAQEGVSAKVVNMFTLKPIDSELIIKCAKETGAIVTAENHNIINGLGSAVSEVLSENLPVPLERVGVRDEFGQVGPVDFLRKAYNLTSDEIITRVKKVLKRKSKCKLDKKRGIKMSEVFGYPEFDASGEQVLTTYDNAYKEMMMDIRVYKMRAGEIRSFKKAGEETAVLLLCGDILYRFEGKEQEVSRKDVFTEGPWCVHVSSDVEVTVEAKTDTEILVQSTHNDRTFESKLYTPEDAPWIYSSVGKFGNVAKRRVNTILDIEIAPYSNMVLGEVLNDPGNWSGYLPHRHPQPETYYFKFDHPEGFGASFVGDRVFKSVDGSFSAIPGGELHPQAVAPGYQMYTCWMIRHLEGNPWNQTDRNEDERYVWLHDAKF